MLVHEHRFIFNWHRSSWDYRLAFFIGLALFGHVLCFYVFHIVYPRTTSLLPPSAQITVLNPNNLRDKSFLSWIEMNDPTQVSAPRFNSTLVPQLIPPYEPIFSTLSPELIPSLPSPPQEQGVPSIFSAESLLPMRTRPVEAANQQFFPSRLDISSTLDKRTPASLPPLPTTTLLSEPTSMFIGVSPEGNTNFVFLRQSSGNHDLDQKAEQFIHTVKFLPHPVQSWGVVTFRWGGPKNDSR